MVSQPIKRLLGFAATVLLTLALMHSQLSLERSWRASIHDRHEGLQFPPNRLLRAASLNHQTLAADFMWIALVTDHSQWQRDHGQASDNLLDNSFAVAEMDPQFYRLYDWAPAAFLNRRYPISAADLDRVADLYDDGIQAFPLDDELRLSAALTFIGYGNNIPDDVRARQAERAARYLEAAVELSPDDAQLRALLRYFRNRALGLKRGSIDRETEEALWLTVLRASSDVGTRRRALEELERLGGHALVDEQRRLTDTFESDKTSYLPFLLWQLVRKEN